MSTRRLLGWEPEERHEHYDAAGNLTGYTVVTREPEFDDAELQRLLAYMAYRRGICDCGLHQSLTGDRSNYFTFDSATCSVCKGLAQYQRVLATEDQRLIDAMGDNPAPAAPRPGDGRRLFVRQLSADEVEKRRPSRASGTG